MPESLHARVFHNSKSISYQRRLLRKLKIEEELSERFVDDELEVLAATAPGVRFEEGKLFKDETKVEEDKKIPDDERTFDLLRNIGNSIFECVQFTVDVPTANPNGSEW